MQIRLANPSEMDDIYLMGYNVWGEGGTRESYLSQCRGSPKYKRGVWYVLADDQGQPVSSLITYRLEHFPAKRTPVRRKKMRPLKVSLISDAIGIGSIATLPALRCQGLARGLVEGVLSLVTREGARVVFLFSDIHPEYYEKIGFKPLPEQYQNKKGSVCMVWGVSVAAADRAARLRAAILFLAVRRQWTRLLCR